MMRPFPRFSITRSLKSLLLFGAVISPSLHAADPTPGQFDPGLADVTALPVVIPDNINSAIPQTDGKIIIVGGFTGINSIAKYHAARLNANGSLDSSYSPQIRPNSNVDVFSVFSQLDGNHFLCGNFSAVNYTPTTWVDRPGLAKFGPTGVVDSVFKPPATANTSLGVYYTLVEQFTGTPLYLVGTSEGMYRLNANGTRENSFTPYPYGTVTHLSTQPDNKILLAGGFFTSNVNYPGVNSLYIERVPMLGANELDTTFKNPSLNGQVRAVSVQNDGKILLGGDFLTVTINIENVSQRGIVRYNADGTLDRAFKPVLAGSRAEVYSIALQADGKILIGGNFRTVSSVTNGVTTTLVRPGIARLNADGSVDPSFDAKLIESSGYLVKGIAVESNGRVLMTGTFQPTGSTTQRRICRLHNDAPVSNVYATSSTNVRWMRGGTLPEASAVFFEYSVGGFGWTPIGVTGYGARINGGWTVDATTPLPASCLLRARAISVGGMNNASRGITVGEGTYPIPRVSAVGPAGNELASGSLTSLAPAGVNGSKEYTFGAKNIGTGGLSVSTVTVSGPDGYLFSVVNQPVSPVQGPGGISYFNVKFSPFDLGTKNATINLYSNDATVPVFSFNIAAESTTPEEAWRFQYFGSKLNAGNAADDADPDGDGQTNRFEFIAGLVPNDPASHFKQRVEASGSIAKVVFSPHFTDRTYEIQSSTTLGNDWVTANGTNADNLLERTFTDSSPYEPKRFYRIKVIKP